MEARSCRPNRQPSHRHRPPHSVLLPPAPGSHRGRGHRPRRGASLSLSVPCPCLACPDAFEGERSPVSSPFPYAATAPSRQGLYEHRRRPPRACRKHCRGILDISHPTRCTTASPINIASSASQQSNCNTTHAHAHMQRPIPIAYARPSSWCESMRLSQAFWLRLTQAHTLGATRTPGLRRPRRVWQALSSPPALPCPVRGVAVAMGHCATPQRRSSPWLSARPRRRERAEVVKTYVGREREAVRAAREQCMQRPTYGTFTTAAVDVRCRRPPQAPASSSVR
ncbi:hypothetical protein C8Q77DRAFT_1139044 [Trametes polyzona]|nr:hypothetical protein C8Q77DRAFT_1139044 [Trametes polyzona]